MNATNSVTPGSRHELVLPQITDDPTSLITIDVDTFVIATPQDAEFVSQLLNDGARRKKQIEDFMEPTRKAAHDLWKGITGLIATMTAPYTKLETLRPRLGNYQQEVERLARIEQQRQLDIAEAERKRLQAIQDAETEKERQRLADEAAFDSQIALAEAHELEQAGDVEGAQAKLQEAEVVAQPLPVYTPPPVFVPPAIVQAPKVAGMSFRDNWKYKITDQNLFFKAIAAGTIPQEYAIINDAVVGKIVKALKGATNIPGLEAYNDRIPQRQGAR